MSSKPFVNAIVSHCWNKDQSKVAIATNNDMVEVWTTEGSPTDPTKWKKEDTLEEHGGFVSAIDWCASTGDIVTCGHDRNAYVWQLDGKEYKPTLVILRINRAATAVKWCPSGKKFAVASGAKCVPVCHYQEKNDWWISKMIKKHKSTVVSVAWSPNNKFVITGSTDFKCRVFSAYVEGIDSEEDEGNFGSVFPRQNDFGQVLAEFGQVKSWINTVAWSPDGGVLAFAGHSSQIAFVDIFNGLDIQVTNDTDLPFANIEFVDDGTLAAVGWGLNPTLFKGSGSSWKRAKVLDDLKSGDDKKKKTMSARDKFRAADSHGKAFGTSASSAKAVKTKHKNTICNLRVINKNTITTCGLDGRIVTWKL